MWINSVLTASSLLIPEVCEHTHTSLLAVLQVNLGYLWSPYGIGQTIIFLSCGFFLLMATLCNRGPLYFCPVVTIFLSFFSSPNLSGRRLDVYHTSTVHTWCDLSANLECMSEMCGTWLAANTGRKKSPFWHHRTTLSGCIFATKARVDNRKKTC